MEDYFLIYVNKLGVNWSDKNVYEFLFTNDLTDVDGEDWDAYPASNIAKPPRVDFVKKVGILTTSDLTLHLIQESTLFAVWDAVDGVVAMAWENMDDYDEYPDSRFAIMYGDTIKDVEDKLFSIDLVLEYDEKKNKKL